MIRRLSLCFLLVSLIVTLGSVAQESKVATQPAESKTEAPAVSPIDEAVAAELADRARRDEAAGWLSKPTSVSFTDITLGDAAKFLSDLHNARIRLDSAVNGEKLSFPDTPVTLVTEKQPLSHVLNRITQSAEAVWTIHRGDILITSQTREKELLETRVYRVGRLLRLSAARTVLPPSTTTSQRHSGGGFGFGQVSRGTPLDSSSEEMFTQFIMESTSVPWQMNSGEGGTLSLLGDQLIVRQTYRGHEEVARLLRFAEAALSRAAGSPPLMLMSPEEAAKLARLQKALRREIELRLVLTPLVDVLPLLRDRLGEDVYIEHSETTKPLTLGNREISLTEGRYVAREALRQMLSPHELTAVIDDGAICITTTEQASLRHLTVIYDVADLLRTNDDRDALQRSIQESTAGPWMELEGQGGTISNVLGGLLVIHHREQVHTEIALLLQELRQARKDTAKEAAAPKSTDLETRFHKAKTKDEAEALERLILTFVAPTSWDVSGGRGVLRTAEDRIIIQQTKAVHDQIDQFLREYQQAKPLGQSPAAAK